MRRPPRLLSSHSAPRSPHPQTENLGLYDALQSNQALKCWGKARKALYLGIFKQQPCPQAAFCPKTGSCPRASAQSSHIIVTEQELIKGGIRKNPQCQQEIFRRHAGKMLALCLRYARHQMEAEDMLQDAFVKVFEHLHTFEGKGAFEGWIRRIVVNTALKHLSKRRIVPESIEETGQHADLFEEPGVYSDLAVEDLLRLIANLPEGYRVVFNLYAVEGYSHKEIGELLNIQESTSRSQLVKARRILQEKILDMKKIAV